MATASGRSFDMAKPLILVILLGSVVAAGFAIKYYRQYRYWDDKLRADVQNWQGYDPEHDAEDLQSPQYTITVRGKMELLAQQVANLPEGFGDAGAWGGIGVFLDQVCSDLSMKMEKYSESLESKRGQIPYEEGQYRFDVKEVSRRDLVQLLYRAETERPVLKTLSLQNLRPSDSKHEDFSRWDAQLVLAYRRAVRPAPR